jgi:predicted phosphodiesterase
MRIAVLSDLHLEFHDEAWPGVLLPAGTDVFVCAGDVATRGHGPARLLALIDDGSIATEDARPFETIFVPGNHDYYHGDYDRSRARMRAMAAPGFHVLDESTAEIGGVTFVGATLWTDFGGSGGLKRLCTTTISDFHIVGGFDADRCAAEHLRQRAFIERALAAPRSRPRVVVTHFCPTLAIDHPAHVGSPLKRYFQVDAEPLMAGADAWIFGHTHHDADITMHGCRVLSAQAGYPGEKSWRVAMLDLAA